MPNTPVQGDVRAAAIPGPGPSLSLAGLRADPDGGLKRVSDALAPMNHWQKLHLYRMIRGGCLEEMTEPVAKLLVEMINGRRSEHARRLWTGWFDPLLVRDDAVLHSGVRLPGCLHLADLGAWWFALSSRMEPQVRHVQQAVTRLSREQPLNEIFDSPLAWGWAEELRQGSLAVLAGLRARPAEAGAVLAEVTGYRAQLLRQEGIRQRDDVARSDIAVIEIALEAAPAWRARPPGGLHGEDPVDAARGMAGDGSCGPMGAALFALAALHRRDEPALGARLHEAFPLPVVRDGITGRLLLAAETLRAALHARSLAPAGAAAVDPGADGPAVPLKRFLDWHDLVRRLEPVAGDRERALVSQALRELGNTVHEGLVPALSRQLAALTAHGMPEPLIEQVGFVNDVQAQFAQRGILSPGKVWRAEDGGHVAAAFRQVAAVGTAEALGQLSRLARLADMLDTPIEITARDRSLASLVEVALRRSRTFDALEAALVGRVIEVSRAERKRGKWWLSRELIGLLEAADQFAGSPALLSRN
ncbi:hypothetical protein [Azospirillum sp. SYSU D00513]|uniref:hypothetical protein n=1 Tax=Azospirillum sp. SYSU D00513 TaxID=2812561 RepID=UPI001A95EEBE|nr:hypothetical protein [Azospirillum sp. SYSU D00513]